MRVFLAVMCGAIITVHGAAGVLLRWVADDDARVEKILCRYLAYCDDEVPRKEVHRALWSGERQREVGAIPLARAYLSRSPASAGRWCMLGDAYLTSGDVADARYAYSQALERGPHSPPILMRAANFQWELGDFDGYLRLTRRVLSLVPDYDAVIFDGYRRAGLAAKQVIRDGLAADPDLAGRYSRYLSARGESVEADSRGK